MDRKTKYLIVNVSAPGGACAVVESNSLKNAVDTYDSRWGAEEVASSKARYFAVELSSVQQYTVDR